MNYRVSALTIRERRDAALEQARRELAELRAARDAEIRRLHSEGLSASRIALELGCATLAAREVLDAALHERNKRRSLDRYHLRAVA